MALNYTVIHGRICNDLEEKVTQSGIEVCNFTVAVDRAYKKGEDKVTDFFNCVAFRGTATLLTRYFSKGKEILVSGSMEGRKYTDKDGNNRIAWELVANSVDFCGSKNEMAQKPSEPKFEEVDLEDTLPF